MQYGPRELSLLSPDERRTYLQQQFPTWYIDGRFNCEGYIAWSTEQPDAVRKLWFCLLAPPEIAKVSNTFNLWSNIYTMRCQQISQTQIYEWLQNCLPFWSEENVFNASAFATWYDCAKFFDKEEVYKILKCSEQKEVLMIWAGQQSISNLRAIQAGATADASSSESLTPPFSTLKL